MSQEQAFIPSISITPSSFAEATIHFLSNPNPNPNDPFLSPAKRKHSTSVRRKASSLSLKSNHNPFLLLPLLQNPNPNPNPNPSPLGLDISKEIIVLNREPTTEAVTTLTAGFPADSLTDEELEAVVVSSPGGIEQVNYILIRNHILCRWRENTSNWLPINPFIAAVPTHCHPLLHSAYQFLLSHDYINFGVTPSIKEQIPAEPAKPNVVVIGTQRFHMKLCHSGP